MTNTSQTRIRVSRLSAPLKAVSAFLAALMFVWPVTPVMGRNLPTGGTVVKGDVTINVNGKTMNIDQTSSKAIVNWESFDIAKGYAVDINQINSAAAMLARVTGGSMSEIYGTLKANGALYLINPNGILFGSGATIDVNKLIASTFDIGDDDFWAGNLKFQGESTASVINNAVINAQSAALIAKNVENHGTINADQAALVGSNGGTIKLENFGNGGELSIDISGLLGDTSEATVVNDGTINAENGQAILTADAGRGNVDAENGTVIADFAEFSGRNSALGHLGNLTVNSVLVDPVANLTIGTEKKTTYPYISTITSSDEKFFSELSTSPDVNCPTSGAWNTDNGATRGVFFRDTDGNAWTVVATYHEAVGTDPAYYTYDVNNRVLTYYNTEYLTKQLELSNVQLDYNGQIASWTGSDITLENNVSIGGTYNLTLDAGTDIAIEGNVEFQNPGTLTLRSSDLVLADEATITTIGSLAIAASELETGSGKNLTLVAEDNVTLNLTGTMGGSLKVTAGKDIAIATSGDGGNLTANGDITFTATAGKFEAAEGASINAAAGGALTIVAGTDVSLATKDTDENGTVTPGSLTGQSVDITADGDIENNATITATAGDVAITAGREVAATQAILSGTYAGGSLSNANDVTITADGNVSLTGAAAVGGKNVTIASDYGSVETAGVWAMGGDATITAATDVTANKTNNGALTGLVAAAYATGTVDVTAGNDIFVNRNVQAGGKITMNASNNLTTAAPGEARIWSTGDDIELTAGGDITTASVVSAGADTATPPAPDDTNPIGKVTITADGNVTTNGSVNGTEVKLTAENGNVTTNAWVGKDATTSVDITANGDVTTNKNVTAKAVTITATEGKFEAAEGTTLKATDGTLTIVAGTDVDLASNDTDGDGTVTPGALTGKTVDITAGGDVNSNAAITANDTYVKIDAGNDVAINADVTGTADSGDNAAVTINAGNEASVATGKTVKSDNGNVKITADVATFIDGTVSGNKAYINATNGAVNIGLDGELKATEKAIITAGTNASVEGLVDAKTIEINANGGSVVMNGELDADESITIDAAKAVGIYKAIDGGTTVDVIINAGTDADLSADVSAKSVNVTAATGEVDVLSTVTASEKATLTAGTDVAINGAIDGGTTADVTLTAGNDADINANVTGKTVTITATTGDVDVDAAATVTATEEAEITAGNDVAIINGAIAASDADVKLTAGNDVTTDAAATIDAKNLTVDAGNNATLKSTTTVAETAILTAGNDVTTEATATINAKNLTVDAGNNANLAATTNVDETATLTAGNDVTTDAAATIDAKNLTVEAGNNANLGADTTVAEKADIDAVNTATVGNLTANDIEIDATDVDLDTVNGKNSAKVTAENGITANNASSIFEGDLELTVNSGDINLKNDIEAKSAKLTANDNVTTQAVTATDGDIEITATNEDVTTNGILTATEGAVTVKAKDNATFKGAVSGKAVNLTATEGNLNATGDIESTETTVELTAGNDAQIDGAVIAKTDATITANGNVTTQAVTATDGNIDITATNEDVTTGALTAGEGYIYISAKDNADFDGDMKAKDVNVITSDGDIYFDDSVTATDGGIYLEAGKDVNSQGKLAADNANGYISVRADGNVSLTDGMIAQGSVNVLSSNGYVNTYGAITATNGSIEIYSNADDVKINGALTATNDYIDIRAQHNVDVAGVSGDSVYIGANIGNVTSTRQISATSDVEISAGQNVDLTADTTSGDTAAIMAGGDITIEGATVAADQAIASGTDTYLFADGKTVTITATEGNVSLTDAAAVAGANVEVTAANGSVTTAGLWATNGNVAVKAGDTVTANETNNGAFAGKYAAMYATGTVNVTAGNDIFVNRNVQAGGIITMYAGDNLTTADTGARIWSTGDDIALTAGGDITTLRVVSATADGTDPSETDLKGIVTITADGNVTTNGKVNGTEVAITAENGNVTTIAKIGNENTTSVEITASKDATIGNTVTAKSVAITATSGDVITKTGADLKAEETNVVLTAGNDITLDGTVTGAANDTTDPTNPVAAVTIDAGRDVTSTALITANTGDATVTANGNVTTAGVTATDGSITITAANEDVTTNGALTATAGAVTVTASKDATIGDAVTAKSVAIEATYGDLEVNGTVEATDSTAVLTAGWDADINADVTGKANDTTDPENPIAAVTIMAANDVTVAAGKTVKSGDADVEIVSGVDATIDGTVTGQSVEIAATFGDLEVNGDVEATEKTAVLTAGWDAEINGTVTGTANDGNIAAVTIVSANDVTIADTATVKSDNADVEIAADRDIEIDGTVSGKNVEVEADNDIAIDETNGAVSADETATFDAGHDADLAKVSAKNLKVVADNASSIGDGMGVKNVDVTVNNEDIVIEKALTADTIKLTATSGDIITETDANLEATDTNVVLTAGQDITLDGTVTGAANDTTDPTNPVAAVTIDAGRDVTATAQITANTGDVTITAKDNAKTDAVTATTGAVTVTAAEGDASTGAVNAGQAVKVEANKGFVDVGAITSTNSDITLNGDEVKTESTLTAENGAVEITATNDVTLAAAEIKAQKVNVETIDGNVNANGAITASGDGITIDAGKNVTVDAAAALTAENGKIEVTGFNDAIIAGAVKAKSVAITATSGDVITKTGADLKAEETNVVLTAGNDITLDGTVTGAANDTTDPTNPVAAVTIDAGRDVTATAQITANTGDVTVTAKDNAKTDAVTATTGAVTVTAAEGDASTGAVNADQAVKVEANKGFVDVGAAIKSTNSDITLNGDEVKTKSTLTANNGEITITATNDVTLAAADIRAQKVNVTSIDGNVNANGKIVASANGITIEAGNDVVTSADGLFAKNGGDINITADEDADIGGKLEADNGNISVTAYEDADIDGALKADNGNITVTAKDNADIAGAMTAKSVAATATEGDLTIAGRTQAKDSTVYLTAGKDVAITANVLGAKDDGDTAAITVKAGNNLTADASILANYNNDASISLTANNNVALQGKVIADKNVTIEATEGAADIKANATATAGILDITAADDVDVTGKLTGNSIEVTSSTGDMYIGGATTATVTTVELAAAKTITIDANVTGTADDGDTAAVTVEAGEAVVINAGKKVTATDNTVELTAGADVDIDGTVTAKTAEIEAGNDVSIDEAKGAVITDTTTINAGHDANVANIDATTELTVNAENAITVGKGMDTNLGAVEMVTENEDIVLNKSLTGESVKLVAQAGNVTAKAGANVEATNGDLAVAAGEDATLRDLTATNGMVKVVADDNATLAGNVKATNEVVVTAQEGDVLANGTIEGDSVTVKAIDGNVTTKDIVTANTGDVLLSAGKNAAVAKDVTATAGNIRIDADEDATVAGKLTATAGNIAVVADDNATLKGAVKAGKEAKVVAWEGDLRTEGEITADTVVLKAEDGNATITNTITAENTAAAENGVSIDAGKDVTTTAAAVIEAKKGAARIVAVDNATIAGNVIADEGQVKIVAREGDAKISGGVDAKTDVLIDAGENATVTGNLTATEGDITVTADDDANISGTQKAEKGDITVTADDDATISGDMKAVNVTVEAKNSSAVVAGNVDAGTDVSITAYENVIVTGEYVKAGNDVTIETKAEEVDIKAAVTAENGSIEIVSGFDVYTYSNLTADKGDINVTAFNDAVIGDDGGDAMQAKNVTVEATEGSLTVSGTTDATDGNVTFTAGKNAEVKGKVTATGNATITAENSVTTNGDIDADGDATITAKEGDVLASGTIEGSAVTVKAIDGNVTTKETVTANTGDVLLSAGKNATVAKDVTAGTAGNIRIDADEDATVAGDLTAEAGDITVVADDNATLKGTVEAGKEAKVVAWEGDLRTEGEITADTVVLKAVDGDVTITNKITAENAAAAENGVSIDAGKDVITTTAAIIEAKKGAARIVAVDNATIAGDVTADNGQVKIVAREGDAKISGALNGDSVYAEATDGDLTVTGATKATDDTDEDATTVTFKAGEIARIDGDVASKAGVLIGANGDVFVNGYVDAYGAVTIKSAQNAAVTGGVDAGKDLYIGARDNVIVAKKRVVGANVTIESQSEEVVISSDVQASEGDIVVNAGFDADINGNLLAENGKIDVTAFEDADISGTMTAGDGNVTVTAKNGDAEVADIVASGNATVTAKENVTTNGAIKAENGDATITAEEGDATTAALTASGNATVTAKENVTTNGAIDAGGDATITAEEGDAKVAADVTADNVTVTAGNDVETTAAIEAEDGNVEITAKEGDATTAALTASGNATVTAKDNVTTNGAIDAGGDATITAEEGDAKVAANVTADNVTVTAGDNVETTAEIKAEDGNVEITSEEGDITNTGDITATNGNVTADAAGDIDNTGAIEATAGKIDLEAGETITSNGTLDAPAITTKSADDTTLSGDIVTEELTMDTTNDDGDITVTTTNNIDTVTMNAAGENADITYDGASVDALTAIAQDGSVDLAGDDLTLVDVQALDDGEINGEAGAANNVTVDATGDVKVVNDIIADNDMEITANGAITDGDGTEFVSGNDMTLESGDHIGDAENGNPIDVEVGGELNVNALPGTPETTVFALVDGTTGDGEIHTNTKHLPGLVVFNGTAWMGREDQMGRIDRIYAEKISVMNDLFDEFNLSNPLSSDYKYFPHVALDQDGFANAAAKGIEKIHMGENGTVINGLPEGLDNTVPGASDFEKTYTWPLELDDSAEVEEEVPAAEESAAL